MVSRFAQIAVWGMLCFGEEHWLFWKGWRILAQHRLSLPYHRRCAGRYLLLSAFWCPSVETVASQHLPGTGWLPVWRHLFLLRTWEEAKVLVWPLMGTWSRVRGSLPLVIENRGSAVRPTHWSQVLGGEELLWGSLGYHCPGGDGRCPAALLKWREP